MRWRGYIYPKEKGQESEKLNEGLIEITGAPPKGEGKCKGWSNEGMVAFEKDVKTIRKVVENGKYVALEKSYQDVMEYLGHLKKDNGEPLQKARCKSNLGVVYEGF